MLFLPVAFAKDKNQDGQVDTEEFLEWVFSGAQHSEKLLAAETTPGPAEAVCLGVIDLKGDPLEFGESFVS